MCVYKKLLILNMSFTFIIVHTFYPKYKKENIESNSFSIQFLL